LLGPLWTEQDHMEGGGLLVCGQGRGEKKVTYKRGKKKWEKKGINFNGRGNTGETGGRKIPLRTFGGSRAFESRERG